ncbi:hypothetical protein MAGR_17660 [Mycolicibacterium agri]|uniref:Uncharacterized protein n=1 Tax=Mycolicibacterium agri TaxID=36811 RepID=A0A7I9VXY1_MYCAG|nr:hypothetical protein MAGR_17660 [Mycolicibacterium agri]
MATYTASSVRDAIRMFNKHVLNPAMLHLAGRKHFYAGVIRHTGRRSGKRYTTSLTGAPVASIAARASCSDAFARRTSA